MNCEVAVVGGGIGGLTVAALLAQRGVDVCLLERESRVGGCAASFEKFDYPFEQGYGLYPSWQVNEIHDRVFSELPVDPPETRLLTPSYLVRLPDQSEITLTPNIEEFQKSLRNAFPECAEEAIRFYENLLSVGGALRRTFQNTPHFLSAPKSQQAFSLMREPRLAAEILSSAKHTAADKLLGVSPRFRSFVDVQLQALAQAPSEKTAYLYAALALTAPLEGMFGIRGGADALANRLAESIRRSGGRVRLNAPVLRIAYDSAGAAQGLDLLSGETLTVSRAIVSNLTIWDTYGKLIGLNHTPSEIRQRLKSLQGWGAYLVYLAMDEAAAERLRSDHVLSLSEWAGEAPFDPEVQLMFSAAPAWDSRAPEGKRSVTLHAFTAADDWFTFHTDETELEEKDQAMLEQCWQRLHTAMPELGNSVEVIDTATPRHSYELTRRRLGMVGGVATGASYVSSPVPGFLTALPNVFLISDTTSPGGIAGLTQDALVLVNHLANL
jgi:phytoene dehydrogenase-like protein